ncbi:MAG: hypothetical protein ABEJ07_00040 [Candidatus Nanohaloarchaea archaeon]
MQPVGRRTALSPVAETVMLSGPPTLFVVEPASREPSYTSRTTSALPRVTSTSARVEPPLEDIELILTPTSGQASPELGAPSPPPEGSSTAGTDTDGSERPREAHGTNR